MSAKTNASDRKWCSVKTQLLWTWENSFMEKDMQANLVTLIGHTNKNVFKRWKYLLMSIPLMISCSICAQVLSSWISHSKPSPLNVVRKFSASNSVPCRGKSFNPELSKKYRLLMIIILPRLLWFILYVYTGSLQTNKVMIAIMF